MSNSTTVIGVVTGGGFLAVVGTIFRGLYLLGSILESFRQHVRSSDNTHTDLNERMRYMERQVR